MVESWETQPASSSMWGAHTAVLLLLAILSMRSSLAAEPTPNPKPDLRDVIGVTHVHGSYHLTNKDFLNEGADQILGFGSRVIKLYLTVPPAENYPFNTKWPQVRTLVELAEAPAYREVFKKPFTTYILTTNAVGHGGHTWIKGMSDADARDEQEQFYSLTKHLLTTYRGTGKTFVLQHWEGDWAIRGNFDRKADPTPVAVEGMIKWLNARQDGVARARREAGQDGVKVFHATEVNLVDIALREKRPTVADKVVPRTRVDLVSYSAWDTQDDPKQFRAALDYIAEHAPKDGPFGRRCVYVGEFGLPENEFGAARVREVVRNVVKTAVDWGCPWVVYWQVYCNEPRRRPVTKNDDVRGFWLLRPDGTRGAACEELAPLWRK